MPKRRPERPKGSVAKVTQGAWALGADKVGKRVGLVHASTGMASIYSRQELAMKIKAVQCMSRMVAKQD